LAGRGGGGGGVFGCAGGMGWEEDPYFNGRGGKSMDL